MTLTERQQRQVEANTQLLQDKWPEHNHAWWAAHLEGYRLAMTWLYSDADEMFAKESEATKVILMALAIEEMMKP